MERVLTDSDAIVWIIERDPALRSTIVGIALLDGPPDHEVIAERVERASRFVPKLRQVIRATTPDGGSPAWVAVPDIDLEYHLRRLRLPEPGTWAELMEAVEQIAMTPFDRARPLWETTVVDGLPYGQGALVMKIHHAITDGLGAFQIARHLIDLEPDATLPGDMPAPPPAETRSALALALGASAERLRAAGALLTRNARTLGERVRAAASDPAQVLEVLSTAPSVARLVAPAGPRRSPLFGDHNSLSWRLVTAEIALDDLKRAAKAVDASVNDAFLGIVSGSLQRYHERMGAPTSSLRMTMPVNIRSGDDPEAGNRFVPVRFDLPIDVTDPAERLAVLGAVAREHRTDPALSLTDTLAAVLNSLPAPVTTMVFGSMLKGVDVVASNVPGSPVPFSVGGRQVLRLFPFAPPAGAALSVTLVSHAGVCCLGIQVDPACVTDLGLFMQGFDEAVAEVLALGDAG